MSMNIYITAIRNATVVVKGSEKVILDRREFNAWQTPTDVTYSIVESDNPVETYINWVYSQAGATSYTEPVYDERDIFGEHGPVGHITVNPSTSHIEEFRDWLQFCADEDFIVQFDII